MSRGDNAMRGWIAGGVGVAVTAAGLVVAATAPMPTRHAISETGRTTAVSRTLVCAGGLKHAVARIGVSGSAATTSLTTTGAKVRKAQATLGSTPLAVTGSAQVAARTYAVRTASDRRWFAAGSCPGPRSDWWFVGVGASQAHRSTLLITNPLAGSALVSVNVLGPKGPVVAPGLRNINVASHAAVTLDLSKVAPAVGDLAAEVRTSRGLVAVSAPESWSPDFVARPTGDWVADQPAASRKVTLAGLSGGGATALVANPGENEAVVQLTLVGAQGTYAPTKGGTVRVPPGSVLPVELGPLLRTHPSAVTLTSNVPVAASLRLTSGTDSAYGPTLQSLGSSSVVGIPPHSGPAQLVLVAGTSKEKVTVTGYAANGKQVGSSSLTVPARASLTSTIWPKATALQISGADAAGGVVVLKGKGKVGLAVLGLVPSASEAQVPPVAPAWIAP